MSPAYTRAAGVILAGGRSARFGGGYKAFASLRSRPMIGHVIERLRKQVEPLLVSVESGAGKRDTLFQSLNLPLVEDKVRSHRGPLAGLYSAMDYLDRTQGPKWLVLCPCDAPFLPRDLVTRLLEVTLAEGLPAGVVRYGDHPQPTFSIWRLDSLAEIRGAVTERGRGGLMHMLDVLPHATVDWPDQEVPPFFNVNTPRDLARAEAWLDQPAQKTEDAGLA